MKGKKRDNENFNDYAEVTNEGKIFIRTSDFFKIDKVQKTINKFLESDLIKEIDERSHAEKIIS